MPATLGAGGGQFEEGSASSTTDQGKWVLVAWGWRDQIWVSFGSSILGAVKQRQLKPGNYCSCKGQKKNPKIQTQHLAKVLNCSFPWVRSALLKTLQSVCVVASSPG